jgi:phosphoribosylamine--glycine ligase
MRPDLYVAPGNAGTAGIAENVSIGAEDAHGLLRFAQDRSIDVTIVGPEAPLAGGLVDLFEEAGAPVFGPRRAAAAIESSKSFAKAVMQRAHVPTAEARVFDSLSEARRHVATTDPPWVVKADGLAAGKGVVMAPTREEAETALRSMLEEKAFGPAGETVLIEEWMTGPEVSVFAFVDGEHVSSIAAACDYKRVGDGDVGPNTGGMGSYSPPPFWDSAFESQVRTEILQPVAEELARMGSPYRGVLYGGLMLTESGPRVVEFNCRLGDPEAQVVLPRLKSDLLDIALRSSRGDLARAEVEWSDLPWVAVVVASGGYPGEYRTGLPITGLDQVDDAVTVFHAGTRVDDSTAGVVTSGGRVLTVTGTGRSLNEARETAYANVSRIHFEDCFYRTDIAKDV